ncbi:MAG: tetratricopeptide repeat protein [Acidobacteria bacterium]|nr:tetratricopeptide repeat protein [Acidobacteriota bacterium]
MRLTEVQLSAAALWKRFSVIVLLGGTLLWAVPHLWAQVRAIRMANVVGDPERLKMALAYDPNQADVHTQLGFYYLYDPFFYNPSQAVHHFEAAVQIHPFDWSAWMDLGRAYEERREVDKAERAYLTGMELAPNYFYPRWAYGNFLLRRGEMERAFKEFRRAADVQPQAMNNMCDLIWQATGGSAETLARFSMSLGSGFAKRGACQFLVARGEHERAVEVWRTVEESDPAKVETGRWLASSLIRSGQWPLAHFVWQVLIREVTGIRGSISPADLAFWNGDFEYDASVEPFDWKITPSQEVEAKIDSTQKYRGDRSLLLEFKRHQEVNFKGVVRYLWVEPSARYRLRFYYKTENVSQENGLMVVLSDAEEPARFNVDSGPIGNENQWTGREVTLETPAQTRVIRLEIVRKPTGRQFDYVEGKVWFDSFSLEPAPLIRTA